MRHAAVPLDRLVHLFFFDGASKFVLKGYQAGHYNLIMAGNWVHLNHNLS
jgi:hypothetical protein